MTTRSRALALVVLIAAGLPIAAFGQQTGEVEGTVTAHDGAALPGVTATATGNTLPRPRTALSDASGRYRLPLLPPGSYELAFGLEGMATEKRALTVILEQTVRLDVTLRPEGVSETIVVSSSAALIDPNSAELKVGIEAEVIQALPVGQEYRDLLKLIPGVQYSEDNVRGPSAGGNGQDNVYLFDGVNVGLPLFGVLATDPSSHDIDQIAIVKGGAKAIDFNRSGGFTVNTVSKSGTDTFHGEVGFQLQNDSTTGDRDTGSDSRFEEDRDWTVASIGGPIARERLFFYVSYYRPTRQRDNASNLYGEVPNFESTRDELFGKLSFTPSDSLLLNLSYRDSDRENTAETLVGAAAAGSTASSNDEQLSIGIFEGSWVTSSRGFLSFKYTDFDDETASQPDNLFGFDIAADGSVRLDVAALDTQGGFLVPVPIAGQPAYNAFIAPLIERYGFVQDGVRKGGGFVGGGTQINNQDFFREGYDVEYDHTFGTAVSHELHFGYQWARDEEDLARESNGWGLISAIGGRSTFTGRPVFYEARFEQQSLLSAGGAAVPSINSQFESQVLEVNDTIGLDRWTLSVGLMASNDQLFGEGLRENPNNLSGFELAVGNRYQMYEIDWEDTLAPRVGAIWSYNDRDTAYVNYARYYPAGSSLPRAASWARNLRRTIRALFDASGNLIGTDPVGSSSGKFFADDLDPRSIDEYLIGTSRQFGSRWVAKAHARYRYGANFWEDTENDSRIRYNPPAGIPRELYIPQLPAYRAEIGGSSYVIAELDGAFTKYYEVNLETDWRGKNSFFRASYVWSHYYGNFDQDNTTLENDAAIFVGSSFVADGVGRQLWDLKYGDLRGDRRHQVKAYGAYNLPWNGTVGAYAIYQSGQPWEAWDVRIYPTTETSSSNRFAEPAGSHTTSDHYQLDLNYTQNFRFGERFNVQLRGDLYNVFDQQTAYNIQNQRTIANFGRPRTFIDPRRLQLAVKFQF